MKSKKLRKSFFIKETALAAEKLLGSVLVRRSKDGSVLKGKIVETEAYLGLNDSSCHSYQGRRTNRTQVMYREGGCSYVYFTYGMHYCFNIITAGKNQPEAVLIRSLEPLKGISIMQKNRNQTEIKNLTSGPAKLCQALNIDKQLNGVDLCNSNMIYLEKGKAVSPRLITTVPRVGLSENQDACFWPLRFYIQNSPFISRT